MGREFAVHRPSITAWGEYRPHCVASIHSNTVEGFFSIFKRGVIGTYHHMSEAHFGRYCREFDFRYNTRNYVATVSAPLCLSKLRACNVSCIYNLDSARRHA